MNSDGELAADLITAELHGALEDPALNSMNFLNEVAIHYPDAISLAAGRPFPFSSSAGTGPWRTVLYRSPLGVLSEHAKEADPCLSKTI